MLLLSNTLTHKKTVFTPHQKKEVTLYVCGITPYDNPHIGHGRCYVFFDFVYRFLKMLGYQVNYCRNYTDIDDKLLIKAEKVLGDKKRYLEIADECIVQFTKDMRVLGNITPTHEPRVTQNIPEIIAFIETLIQKKYAYVSGGNVYFSIETFSAYGKLSKQNREELLAGIRHDVREDKKNPLDFALWKAEKESFFWQSPWGIGRPGWHIECSALAKKYLGEFVDIHGGGLDLSFPHHENEIAQSESFLGHEFVKYWLHVGLVTVNNEKMSKSLSNFMYLQDILAHVDPMVLRYYYLTHHYRSPLPFSLSTMEGYQKAYKKLCVLFADVKAEKIIQLDNPFMKKLLEVLQDDFNVPAMFGLIFEHVPTIKENGQLRIQVKTLLQEVCGLSLQYEKEEREQYSPEIESLLAARDEARKKKDWKTADKIRDQLIQLGVEMHDKKLK